MRLRVGHWNGCLEEAIRAFANQFSEQSPVPLVRRSSPLGGPIAIHHAVVEHIGTLVAVVLIEPGVSAAEPDVMTSRRHSADDAKHGARQIRGMRDAIESRLWAGYDQVREPGSLDPGTDFGRSMLKSPSQC